MLWLQTKGAPERRRGLKLRAITFVLGSACSFAFFFFGKSEAFEKWEKPLGWNPQYGPRYVVFWGGPADHKEPRMGTCSYEHYATIPVSTEPPLSPFEDFHIAKLYEDAKSKAISPFSNDRELAKLTRLPFHMAPAEARYAQLEEDKLPFSRVQNVPKLLQTAKAIASEISVEFLKRAMNAAGLSAIEAASLEGEAAQVHIVVLSVYEAIKKAAEPESEERNADIYARLNEFLKHLRRRKAWDSLRYAYWLDASHAHTQDQGDYYVPELETSMWESAVAALSLVPPKQGNPYSQLLSSNASFKDCHHFLFSRTFGGIVGRELFCQDAFFALTNALRKANAAVIAVAGERGKKILETAGQRLEEALANAKKTIQFESPFYYITEQ